MADGNEESEDGEVSFNKPLELFKQKKNSAHMYTNGYIFRVVIALLSLQLASIMWPE